MVFYVASLSSNEPGRNTYGKLDKDLFYFSRLIQTKLQALTQHMGASVMP